MHVPRDQLAIPYPRLGFCGPLDDLVDLEWLDGIAAARPSWQIILLGSTGRATCGRLPRSRNIRALGGKALEELPAYLSDWDVALLPLRRDQAASGDGPLWTRRLLHSGRPVVSTAIAQVVHPFGCRGVVHIASAVADAVAAIEATLGARAAHAQWLLRADEVLTSPRCTPGTCLQPQSAAPRRNAPRYLREPPRHPHPASAGAWPS